MKSIQWWVENVLEITKTVYLDQVRSKKYLRVLVTRITVYNNNIIYFSSIISEKIINNNKSIIKFYTLVFILVLCIGKYFVEYFFQI